MIKITNFLRDTHDANSSLFLLFTDSDSQYHFNAKRFHPSSSRESRNISRSVEVGIWFLADINGYLELHVFHTVAWASF